MGYFIKTTEEQISRALDTISRKIGQLALQVVWTDSSDEKACNRVHSTKHDIWVFLDNVFIEIRNHEGLDPALQERLAVVRVRFENMLTDIVKQLQA